VDGRRAARLHVKTVEVVEAAVAWHHPEVELKGVAPNTPLFP
jgi:hypothetical protein